MSHSKKADFICQEIFAKLAMYNFCQMITQPVAIKKEKIYSCKVSFSDAVHICMQFVRSEISPPTVETLLIRFIFPLLPGKNGLS